MDEISEMIGSVMTAENVERLQQAATNYYKQMNSAYSQQQMYNQYWQSQRMLTTATWVFNGEPLTLVEFADKIYGNTPQRTEFILRHSSK